MNEYKLSSNGALAQNSSGGKLLKWKIRNKFIKTSTYDQSQLKPVFLYESYAEVIAYKIAKHLGFNAIPYKLCKITIDNSISTIACECEDFRIDNEQYLSIGKLMITRRIQPLYYGDMSAYDKITSTMQSISGFNRQLRETILLDSLILNDDRHYGNFGILQQKDGKCRPAPIFDNGNSLLCHKHIEQLEYSDDLIEYLRCKPFSTNFDMQLNLVGKLNINIDNLKQYINKLINDMVNTYELPEYRARFIKKLLHNRIKTIQIRLKGE